MALWAVGPKYGDRQLLEERKAQGRMRAAEHASGGEMETEVSSAGNLEIPLRPLYGVLAGGLAIAWTLLWWSHLRQGTRTSDDTTAESVVPAAKGNSA